LALPSSAEFEVFAEIEAELADVGVRLLDLLVLDRHRWRSVAEEIG
jgi:hypothetical protein